MAKTVIAAFQSKLERCESEYQLAKEVTSLLESLHCGKRVLKTEERAQEKKWHRKAKKVSSVFIRFTEF